MKEDRLPGSDDNGGMMRNILTLGIAIFAASSLWTPCCSYGMDLKREVLPLIEMLQAGKAKVSPDKKSIIDENGHIIGKEAATLDLNKYKPKTPQNPFETAKDNSPPTPQLFTCTKKCGMITKHCYLDENENAVCINICDKESLICE